MDSQTLGAVVRRLRRATLPPDPPTDTDLVRAFAAGRDPAAFAEIVRRHGPLVLGVCRRHLHPADADDAFQATFLVLVRKADGLRRPDRLAGWLHQVAHRTARKLRAARLARSCRERELFDVPAGEAPADFVWRELRPIFDEEVGRLPDRLRLPAVLCLLEGRSKREAANTLGWPEGTVAGRLQRARERLRARLAARGLTLSAGALAAALFEGAGSAAVSEALVESTLQAATLGPALAVRALADGVTQAMFHAKIKSLAAAVLAVGLVGTGTGVVLVPGTGPGQVIAGDAPKAAPKQPAPTPKANADDDPKAALPRPTAVSDLQRGQLLLRLKLLQGEVEREGTLFERGFLPRDASRSRVLQYEIDYIEAELRRAAGKPVDLGERLVQQAELDVLKERLAWEERMVKKGYLNEAQVQATRRAVTRAEAALALVSVPKAPDPRRATMEELIRKLEQIVENRREGVRKGVVPEAELLKAEADVLQHKLKLLDLPDSVAPTPKLSSVDGHRSAIEEKARELARAEILFKQNAISAEEVRRLRIDLSRLRAVAAEAAGDYAAAVQHREAVNAELDAIRTMTKTLVARGVVSLADMRAVDVAVAEAKVEALRAALRRELAAVVAIREQELGEAKALYAAKAIAAEDVQKAERALAEAKRRLAEER